MWRALTSLLTSLSLCIQITGPLMPLEPYAMLNTYVISIACYIAIGMVLILSVFPQTLNHEWMREASKIVDAAAYLVVLQDEVLGGHVQTMDSPRIAQLRSGGDKLAILFHGCEHYFRLYATLYCDADANSQ